MSCWYSNLLANTENPGEGVVLEKVVSTLNGVKSPIHLPNYGVMDYHLQGDLVEWYNKVFFPWAHGILSKLRLDEGVKDIYTAEYLDKVNTAITGFSVAQTGYLSMKGGAMALTSSLEALREYQAEIAKTYLEAVAGAYKQALMDQGLTPVSMNHITTASSYSKTPETFPWRGEVITQHVLFGYPERPGSGSVGSGPGGMIENIKRGKNPLPWILTGGLGLMFWHSNANKKKK